MQAQMNPALAAALTLQQAAQQGQFSPTTPSGQPTVVEQLMQQVSPPAVQDVAQQAALGGQIQAMQQQQAAQQAQNPQAVAQMVAQMLQSRQAPGIEGLNPNIQGFAEGGIVGYAGSGVADETEALRQSSRISPMQQRERDIEGLKIMRAELARDEARLAAGENDERLAGDVAALRREIRRLGGDILPSQPVATEQSQLPTVSPVSATSAAGVPTGGIASVPVPSGAGSAAAMRAAALKELENIQTQPPTAEQVGEAARRQAKARSAFLQSQGLDSEFLRKEEEEAVARGQKRMAYADQLASELEARRGSIGGIPRAFADFLLNAQGFKGQGAGQIFRTGVAGMERGEAMAREEGRKVNELRFAYEDALTKERLALRNARQAIAMGDWKTAYDESAEAQKAKNSVATLGAQLRGRFASDISGETEKKTEIERLQSRLASLRLTDPEAAKRLEEDIAFLRGAGRKPSPQESRTKVLEQYADNWEKMDLVEKNVLKNQGIKTFEEYVRYRDRIAGAAPSAAPSAPTSGPYYAVNPKTGERIMSTDGVNWKPAR